MVVSTSAGHLLVQSGLLLVQYPKFPPLKTRQFGTKPALFLPPTITPRLSNIGIAVTCLIPPLVAEEPGYEEVIAIGRGCRYADEIGTNPPIAKDSFDLGVGLIARDDTGHVFEGVRSPASAGKVNHSLQRNS